jgi:hypothetical protein
MRWNGRHSFDQKRHLRMSSGSPFFALTLQSSPQPQTAALSTQPQGVDNLIGFQNTFLSMNHQNPAAKWSAFNQKRHSMLGMGTPFSAWTLLSLPHPMRRESMTPLPSNW